MCDSVQSSPVHVLLNLPQTSQWQRTRYGAARGLATSLAWHIRAVHEGVPSSHPTRPTRPSTGPQDSFEFIVPQGWPDLLEHPVDGTRFNHGHATPRGVRHDPIVCPGRS